MFKINTEINDNRVADLLCSAFEGGSNYWYKIDYSKSVKPENVFPWDISPDDKTVYRHVQWPLSEGGRLFIQDNEDGEYSGYLDRESIQKGLQIMGEKWPRHMANFVSENEDAETGDVFLQCCLFGDIIFG